MEAWWDRYPQALNAEEAALSALGFPWSKDETEWAKGRLVVRVAVPYKDTSLNLTAQYPDTYPYFPPQVSLDGPTYQRHQHPLGNNLCLLAREGEGWQPCKDTLAVLIREQLPILQAVVADGADPSFVADNEDHTGEPFSSFLPYPPNCVIVVPDETPPPECTVGRLTFQVRPTRARSAGALFINGALRVISDMRRKSLVEFSTTAPAFTEALSGFWMRLPQRPNPEDGLNLEEYFFELMLSEAPEFKKALETARRGEILIAGFVYPDEKSWRRNSDDWVFLAVQIQRESKRSRPAVIRRLFIRTDWGGVGAWMQRAPALQSLRTKSALVVGLGSLGSPLVLHLARAGIEHLYLVDHDHLQVGNSIRWALGWQYAGLHKVTALATHLSNEYPYTNVEIWPLRLGAPTEPNDTFFSDYDLIRTLSDRSDLIIDASASHLVSHFVADLARELSKPYLWLTTTHGAAGGVVGRIIPGRTLGCWHCFQRSLADRSIRLPADVGSGEIQPGGCSQPTFIGAGIDSDEVALLASRLAVATLSRGEPAGYPDFGWDVAVGDFSRNGLSIVPEWTTYDLSAHVECPACNAG